MRDSITIIIRRSPLIICQEGKNLLIDIICNSEKIVSRSSKVSPFLRITLDLRKEPKGVKYQTITSCILTKSNYTRGERALTTQRKSMLHQLHNGT